MRERVRITKLCSECGALVRFVDGQERLVDLSMSVQTYCPDCGAHDSFMVGNCAPGNNWEIVDDKSIIYSGPGDVIQATFRGIRNHDEEYDDLVWTGDLKLVEVHEVYNG